MRCARRASKRSGLPSGLVSSGRPYLPRALLLVTRGGLFWMVALDPARWAIRGLGGIVYLPDRAFPPRAPRGAPSRRQALVHPVHVRPVEAGHVVGGR